MKNYLIYGLARSGLAAAGLLLKTGRVFLFDEKPSGTAEIQKLVAAGAVLLKREDLDLVLPQLDLLVISPGISIYNPLVMRARESGVKISGELEIGFQNTPAKIIAVTGTNGKTTTSSMIYGILKEAGVNAHLLGNIGTPLCARIDEINSDDFCVVETSSFQLETIEKFRPHIAALTNITPDHIDRHRSFQNYIFTKARIFENQTEDDFAVLNADDANINKLVPHIKSQIYFFSTKEKVTGAYLSGDFLFFSPDGKSEIKIMPASDLKVKGLHNIENALCAAAAALIAGIGADAAASALKKFLPVPHRMEYCGKIKDVDFINDSKATNVSSVLPALSAFTKNVCLILGGRDKDSDFDLLFQNLSPNIAHMLFLGEAAGKLAVSAKKCGKTNFTEARSLNEAVRLAYAYTEPSGVVLLSPACASFDMFENFEDRGTQFEKIFKELKDEIEN